MHPILLSFFITLISLGHVYVSVVVQEQLDKLEGKRQRRLQDKTQQENGDILARDVAVPSKKTNCQC